ncbi:MAG: hypothetical protein IPQ22_03045 [Rhodoferax sp.]|nr:hypothetical protein [Rhodoferax sp.]
MADDDQTLGKNWQCQAIEFKGIFLYLMAGTLLVNSNSNHFWFWQKADMTSIPPFAAVAYTH